MTSFAGVIHDAAQLFPMLERDELRALADDIRDHGLRNPITLDASGALLDGRNRLSACEMAGVAPTFHVVDAEPVGYVISQNIHRRHLTVGQRAVLALDVERMYAAEPKDKGGRPAKDQKPRTKSSQVPEDRKTRKRAAKAVGVGRTAVDQASRLQESAPDLLAGVASGQVRLNQAHRKLRDRQAEERAKERAKAEAAAQLRTTRVELRLGDFREVLADVRDVDAIITDPPYPFEFLPLLGDLASWADKVLRPDGVLVVLMGQTYLPDVLRLLDGPRPFRWMGCYFTPGPSYVSHARKCSSNWKPLLVYGSGPRFNDVVRAEGDDKNHHRWGQDYAAFSELVRRFTEPDALVVDPFAGAGTTLLAAHHAGRHALGAEIDPVAHASALARLA